MTTTTKAAAERAAFEAWITGNGTWPRAAERSSGGGYVLAQTHAAWTAWQACAASPKVCEQLGMALVDFIANDGCRNAAGGVYATRVQEFAMEVQRAFAQENGLLVRGLTDAEAAPDFPSGGDGEGGLTQCDMHEDEST